MSTPLANILKGAHKYSATQSKLNHVENKSIEITFRKFSIHTLSITFDFETRTIEWILTQFVTYREPVISFESLRNPKTLKWPGQTPLITNESSLENQFNLWYLVIFDEKKRDGRNKSPCVEKKPNLFRNAKGDKQQKIRSYNIKRWSGTLSIAASNILNLFLFFFLVSYVRRCVFI